MSQEGTLMPPSARSEVRSPQVPGDRVEADLVEHLGYRQHLTRFLRPFDSFAVAFSFISITTGIFTTFGFLLTNAGPRGIWTWPIVVVGQLLVALVYGALVSKIPLAGYSYQWGARLAGPSVGWWLGWLSFAFLSIVTVTVDYALAQVALMPLLGLEYTPGLAAAITMAVIALQATLILLSTRITLRVNNIAVAFEMLGILQLVIIAVVAGPPARGGGWGTPGWTGIVPASGWYGWLGPFMLATLLGAYTIVGFEASANLAEETRRPRRETPRAMVAAVAASGALGMVFLIALTRSIGDIEAVSADPSPVAAVLRVFFGGAEFMLLSWMVLSIFACGMVIMATNSRLIWSMARDGRLPGARLLARTPRTTGGPSATVLAALVSGTILATLWNNTEALFTLFTTATLTPAILYAATVVLYVVERRFIRLDPGPFQLGRWETPVVAGALLWLAYELVILIAPAQFRPAQRYAVGAVALGALVYALMWVIDPAGMRRRTPLPAGHASADLEEGEDWLEEAGHLHPDAAKEPVQGG
jgi:amino acid transporter